MDKIQNLSSTYDDDEALPPMKRWHKGYYDMLLKQIAQCVVRDDDDVLAHALKPQSPEVAEFYTLDVLAAMRAYVHACTAARKYLFPGLLKTRGIEWLEYRATRPRISSLGIEHLFHFLVYIGAIYLPLHANVRYYVHFVLEPRAHLPWPMLADPYFVRQYGPVPDYFLQEPVLEDQVTLDDRRNYTCANQLVVAENLATTIPSALLESIASESEPPPTPTALLPEELNSPIRTLHLPEVITILDDDDDDNHNDSDITCVTPAKKSLHLSSHKRKRFKRCTKRNASEKRFNPFHKKPIDYSSSSSSDNDL